jgi:hypothetical protein
MQADTQYMLKIMPVLVWLVARQLHKTLFATIAGV